MYVFGYHLFVLKAAGLICGNVSVDLGRELQVLRVNSESRDGVWMVVWNRVAVGRIRVVGQTDS